MTKTIAKEVAKLNKVPHPKSRKAARLSKKAIRAASREKLKLIHHMKVNVLGEKLIWFKNNLAPEENYTPELTMNLIESYLNRFDEELKQIKLKHAIGKRKGRQHANREDIIKMTIKSEKNEYLTCGIEMPDILNPKQLSIFKNWTGELRYLQNFELVRYSKEKLKNLKESSRITGSTLMEKDDLLKDNLKSVDEQKHTKMEED